MLAYWPGLIGFLLVLRLLLSVTEELAPLNNIWQKSRIRQGLAAIGAPGFAPADGAGLVVMLGASEALLGFQPRDFDALMAGRGLSTRSYNLAFQNVGTMVPLYLARVRWELERAGVRPKVALVALPLPRLTRKARENFFSQVRYHDIDSVFFEPGLWARVDGSLADKLILMFNKWVLGERSLAQLQRSTSQAWRALVPWSSNVRASADPFYREELHPEPAWDPGARGGYYLNIEKQPDAAARVIEAAREHEALIADLKDLIRCCDVLDLRLDEEHLQEVAAALRSLRTVADHVVLVTYPESPRLRRPREAEERARSALRLLAGESGIEVWDSAEGAGLGLADYFDHSHLTPEGVKKHLGFLARRFPAEWLKGGQAR